MSSIRLPLLCAGMLTVFAATMGPAGCSDSETTTGDVTSTTAPTTSTTMPTSTTTSVGGNTGGGGTGPGGTGGGGMINVEPTEECPGGVIAIDHGFAQTFSGDTTNAIDDYASGCETESGPDVVYQLNVLSAGTFGMSVLALDGQDISVHLRTACTAAGSTLFCRNHDQMMENRGYQTHLDAGAYYLIIDTEGQTGGAYSLDMVFAEAVCGDSVTNPGEQCDDGDMTTGDGCDNCVLEEGSNDSCDDPQVAPISAGAHVFEGNTLGNTKTQEFDDVLCGIQEYPPAGNDRFYALVPQVSGTLSIRMGWDETNQDPSYCAQDFSLDGCWDRVIHVRHLDGASGPTVCANINNQIACADDGDNPTYTQDFSFPVVANETYYVIVDSYWDGGGEPAFAAGPYYMHVNLQ